ncbi:uncharacterized protein LOC124126619 [Haliotis rufescens]|uniref:uncharacterized protein LOC124126619 n=1 Tax=Haliotis rufescens TaxID=6454 RepID=UPI00201F09F1|nr:uncharacterized protein LOC124126619 [Haliotis rufescens]
MEVTSYMRKYYVLSVVHPVFVYPGVNCATLSRIPAMAAEDMEEIAQYASWHAANTMKRYRADAQRDESKVRRHYDSLCSSGVFSNEFCSVYEQMAWAAAWSTASERFGTKKDARLYKKKWLDFHMELFRSKEVTSQLANDLRSLCWSSAWYTANTRKGYRRDAEADVREMDVYYDRIRILIHTQARLRMKMDNAVAA